MDDVRPDAVAARVVAWHNRHPLARRITAAQVESVGLVSVPFLRDGGRKAERAFSEDFIPPLRSGTLTRWVRRFGREPAALLPDVPLREVQVDPTRAAGTSDVVRLFVTTAAVVHGDRRLRLLLGPGAKPAVLGPRHWSPLRVGGLLSALVLGTAVLALRVPLPHAEMAEGVAKGVAQGVAKLAEASASASARLTSRRSAPAAEMVAELPPSATAEPDPASDPVAPVEPASPTVPTAQVALSHDTAAASAPHGAAAAEPVVLAHAEPVAAAAPPPAPPPSVEPQRGRVALPALRPQLDDTLKAQAREAGEAARAARGTPAPAASTPSTAATPTTVAAATPGKSSKTAPAARSAAPAPESARAAPQYALTTRPLRTRAESEQVMVAMRSWVSKGGGQAVRVEVLEAGDDWRVVVWPFSLRSNADKMRGVIVSHGMRVETVEF